jgi:AAHS family 4-hydroxybenzoate transporter-like MFS transporter
MNRHADLPRSVQDVGHLLDAGRFGTMQRFVVLLAALSIVMDGFDGQMIGFAIPAIIKEWGIARSAFAPAVAAGLVGMGIGSACGGLFADRFGRRWAVIGSVALFGFATASIGLAQDVATIAVLRFIAGLGIGGALPSSTTMTAEFTPARLRTVAVTATIVCVPLGGMLAGLFSSQVLPAYGWRALFFVGGALGVGLAAVLWLALPESPRFLARRRERWAELERLLKRMGLPVSAGAGYEDAAERKSGGGGGFGAVFADGRARDTVAIWCAFFMSLLAIYSAFSWLPTMLSSQGLDVGMASGGLTAYNMGGVLGALGCSLAFNRYGSRLPLLLACLGAAGSAFALLAVDAASNPALFIAGLGVHGMFANAVQSTMYALCAFVYPTSVRATGTASGLAFGRLGAILSAFAGAMVITAGGATGYMTLLGGAMLLALIALSTVRKHLPRPGRGA